MAGEFWMCYFNMALNELTSKRVSIFYFHIVSNKKSFFFSFSATQKHNTAVHLNTITSSALLLTGLILSTTTKKMFW